MDAKSSHMKSMMDEITSDIRAMIQEEEMANASNDISNDTIHNNIKANKINGIHYLLYRHEKHTVVLLSNIDVIDDMKIMKLMDMMVACALLSIVTRSHMAKNTTSSIPSMLTEKYKKDIQNILLEELQISSKVLIRHDERVMEDKDKWLDGSIIEAHYNITSMPYNTIVVKVFDDFHNHADEITFDIPYDEEKYNNSEYKKLVDNTPPHEKTSNYSVQ